MKSFSAPLIYTGVNEPVIDHVITTDDHGSILTIKPEEECKNLDIQYFDGAIVPGLVNAHCHLELSHMRGIIPTGTKLVEFIRQIVTRRNEHPESILPAIRQADEDMYRNGIVAVGDISNVIDTFAQKQKSKIQYHTFIEAFDLFQKGKAGEEMNRAVQVYEQLQERPGHKKSIVPHAPYSVSDELFSLIAGHIQSNTSQSIHHQETIAEDQFVKTKTGELIDFFTALGLSFDSFIPDGKPASHRVMAHMKSNQKTLLVHNTMSTTEDIKAIEAWNQDVYWVTCPNANLYIENRLPRYQYWMDAGARMCIGTDSLASNWQLDILEEIKTILKYQSMVTFNMAIKWATMNGAKALGFDDTLGSIEVGKRPGLVLINRFDINSRLPRPESNASRII